MDEEDFGWEDVNEEPRFGLPVHVVLADTQDSLDDHFVAGALLNAGVPHVFAATSRAGGGGAFAVKHFARAAWALPTGEAFMCDLERKRAAREVDILRHLDCPEYLVKLTACFITRGFVSLVMPMYASDLHALYFARVHNGAGFSDAELRAVAARTLTALAYLHETLHVVHRDVKLLNIFLRVGGDVRTCVLADVGHSRSLATGELASTRRGLGTQLFAPPEFLLRRKHTHAVDIYQLGACLVALLICAGPGGVAEPATLFNDQAHFEVPEWEAAARAGGPGGAARRDCIERMMEVAPLSRGTARKNLEDAWVSGAVVAA
jgi:serine/threonine protein kinase